MAGGGGKGGSQTQTTKVEIPKWLEDAAKANIARAEDVSALGYTPYYGPDVAAFSPMQEAAFANTGAAAGAFGLPGAGMTGMEGMPQVQDFGGVRGYSSAPIYQNSLDAFAAAAPGQADYLAGMFIDPVTGQPGRLFGAGSGSAGGTSGKGGGTAEQTNPFFGNSDNRLNSWDGPERERQDSFGGTTSTGGGFGFGGYSGIGDMFDGGGPGASGDTFSGGGVYSGIANAITKPRGSA